jgi:hypothetical protein
MFQAALMIGLSSGAARPYFSFLLGVKVGKDHPLRRVTFPTCIMFDVDGVSASGVYTRFVVNESRLFLRLFPLPVSILVLL